MSETETAINNLYEIMERSVMTLHECVKRRDRSAVAKLRNLYHGRYDKIIQLLDAWPENEILNDDEQMLDFAKWKWFTMDMHDLVDYLDYWHENLQN